MSVSETLQPEGMSPAFISAGILKEPRDVDPFLEVSDQDVALLPALTLGSFTMEAWAGNEPRGETFTYRTGVAGNCIGLKNSGREGMQQLGMFIRDFRSIGGRVILSVTNLPHEKGMDVVPDLAAYAAELEPAAIEVNLSCPNGIAADGVSLHPPICNNPDASEEIMRAVRSKVGKEVKLGAKDAPHVGSPQENVNQREVIRLIAAVRDQIDFLTGINTIGNQEFEELTATAGKDGEPGKGGMSGPIVTPVAHEWLKVAREQLPSDKAILSCGGIESFTVHREAARRLNMGALMVGGAQEFYRSSDHVKLALDWGRRLA